MPRAPAIPYRHLSEEDQRIARLSARVRYVPKAIERTEAKLQRLRKEASSIGLSLPSLEGSHYNGGMIATEYLKRLGYFR